MSSNIFCPIFPYGLGWVVRSGHSFDRHRSPGLHLPWVTKADELPKFTSVHLLRSSLVSRHGKPRDESWKARARAVKKQFRPGPLESSTRSGWVMANKAQTYWPRLEGLAPWFLRNANCQDTYELLSNRRRCRGSRFALRTEIFLASDRAS